jgi:hypothetical protein
MARPQRVLAVYGVCVQTGKKRESHEYAGIAADRPG